MHNAIRLTEKSRSATSACDHENECNRSIAVSMVALGAFPPSRECGIHLRLSAELKRNFLARRRISQNGATGRTESNKAEQSNKQDQPCLSCLSCRDFSLSIISIKPPPRKACQVKSPLRQCCPDAVACRVDHNRFQPISIKNVQLQGRTSVASRLSESAPRFSCLCWSRSTASLGSGYGRNRTIDPIHAPRLVHLITVCTLQSSSSLLCHCYHIYSLALFDSSSFEIGISF